MNIEEQVTHLQDVVKKQEKEIKDLEAAVHALQRALLLPKEVNYREHEYHNLKLLIQSQHWPDAVDLGLVCKSDSEEDKVERAEGIIDLVIDQPIENSSFLDFGCGEGHVVHVAIAQHAKKAVGHDITFNETWKIRQGIFTTVWDEVVQEAPYNTILMYDVLDHMLGDEIVLIEKIKTIKITACTLWENLYAMPSLDISACYTSISRCQ